MEPEKRVENDEKEEPPKPRLLLNKTSGRVLVINRFLVDSHFERKKSDFEKNCATHLKLMQEYHFLRAHYCERQFPADILKKITESYGNESQSSQFFHAYDELEKQMAEVEKRVARSEVEHRIGYPDTPENMCFAWINSLNIPAKKWGNFESTRAALKKEERENMVDYYIECASDFLKTVYLPQIERMMNEEYTKSGDLRYALKKKPAPFAKPVVAEKKDIKQDLVKKEKDSGADDKIDESNENEVKLSKGKSRTKSKVKSCCVC